MRARMAIWVSGITVELREIVLRDKPSAMLELSPKGTVPVALLPGGHLYEESFDIMLWALGAADPDSWLKPEEGSYDEMVSLIKACDGDFKHHLDRYKYASRYQGADALSHRAAAEGFLRQLEGKLSVHRYLFGPVPCLADYAIMPFVRQYANVDKGWFSDAPYPYLQRWLTTLMGAPPFTEVMPKYPQWHAGQVPTFFGSKIV